jgi:hypothetical protein
MRNTILLACATATALFMVPAIGAAQTTRAATNPESPVTANPKSNANTPQCTQPAPGQTHMSTTNCPNVPKATPKTMPVPKAKTKQAKTAAEAKPAITTPPLLPAAPNACPKTGTIASTPSNPQCDTNSGAHEGGPFGH